ncbi:helix-turn-helix transcriptional regulator [Microbacterium sp. UBA3486]|uniref:helix-turn-helix transcriptional regulator n=1 Tax=Microbacterium TaxID=33882 RepID=UPI0025EE0606|nr:MULTISPECIES: helix-turn-helix transcriptional regulator [Microbacterium]
MPNQEPDLSQLRLIFNDRRDAAGFTYDELAERSGLARQTLLNLASGKYHGDLRTWMLLARAFEVDLDTLLAPTWESGS